MTTILGVSRGCLKHCQESSSWGTHVTSLVHCCEDAKVWGKFLAVDVDGQPALQELHSRGNW
jgi:hypothetical protein